MSKYNKQGVATLTLAEAAKEIGISLFLARRLASEGKIPTIRLGKLIRVPRVRLEAWLAGNTEPKQTS